MYSEAVANEPKSNSEIRDLKERDWLPPGAECPAKESSPMTILGQLVALN